MPETILNKIPDSFIIGTTVNWTNALADYPAGDGWLLQHVFVQDGDQQIVAGAAYESGDTFLTQLTAAISLLFTAGVYHYQVTATLGSEIYDIGLSGQITAVAGFAAQADGLDARDHVEKVLDLLEAAIEGRATEAELSYSISTGDESRSISLLSLPELIQTRDLYRRYLRDIKREDAIAHGQSHEDVIRTRFV